MTYRVEDFLKTHVDVEATDTFFNLPSDATEVAGVNPYTSNGILDYGPVTSFSLDQADASKVNMDTSFGSIRHLIIFYIPSR